MVVGSVFPLLVTGGDDLLTQVVTFWLVFVRTILYGLGGILYDSGDM